MTITCKLVLYSLCFLFPKFGFRWRFSITFSIKKTLVNVKRGTQLKFVFNLDVFCTTLVANKDTFVALMVLPTLTNIRRANIRLKWGSH